MRSLLLALAASLILAAPAAATPSWLAAVDLGAETAAPSTGRIALGSDGTAVAAWAQATGGNTVLQVARRKPGEGFGAAITVPNTGGAGNVRVGVDGAGNATMLYEAAGQLVVVPWPATSAGPGDAQPLGAGTGGELAVGRNGTAVATWLDVSNVNQPFVRAAVRTGAGDAFGAGDQISSAGNGMGTIKGLDVAVGDAGHATVVWSRTNLVPQTVVEANDRAPSGAFSAMGLSVSITSGGAATEPAVAVDAAGRSTVLWTHALSGLVKYAERGPGDAGYSLEQPVAPTGPADTPAVGAAPSGAVVAAWRSSGTAIVAAARLPGGAAFGAPQGLSGPGMNPSLPQVAVGGNGDAIISWSLGDGSALPTIQRKANGALGPILNATSNANQPPGENQSFFASSIGIDDQGNGVAAWSRNAFRNPTNFVRFQAASFDAAAPVLSSTVPPGGTVGTTVGMVAAAADRVSSPAITWAFGDGGSATGGAVSHAFGTAGAFNVTITATDGAGNATSQTHPILVAPAKKKRIRSKIKINWGVTSTRTFLIKLKIKQVPKRGRAKVTCKPKKACPFKKVSSRKRRKGAITLFKNVKLSKVQTMKKRTFRPSGQRVELRITAPGYIGKVVRYKVKRGKVPAAKTLCLPVGKKKPRKRCP